jgi:oxaloacetate decarboxylase gamma subunit
MLVSELLLEGANLMLLGMGIVFTFLAILVLAMISMSRLARTLARGEAHEALTPRAAAALPGMEKGDELVAVISAAVGRYRSEKPR